MKILKLPKLLKEELGAAITLPKFIEKFLPIFSQVIDTQNNTLLNNIDMRNNLAGQYIELNEVKGTELASLRISWERKDIPLEMRLVQIAEVNATGVIVDYGTIGLVNQWAAATNIPVGFIECDGRALKRADYPELFAILGTTYNTQTNPTTGSLWSSPGSDEFRIPDSRGIFLRHAGTSVKMVTTAGSASVVTSVGMVSDDSTARNGLSVAGTNVASSISGTANSGVNLTHSHGISDPGHRHGVGVFADGSGALQLAARSKIGNGSAVGDAPSGLGYTGITIANSGTLDHSHSVSGTANAQAWSGTVGAGDTETRVRNRGVLNIIQVSRISTSSVPMISPNWKYDGAKITGSVLNVDTTKKYNARIWVQS